LLTDLESLNIEMCSKNLSSTNFALFKNLRNLNLGGNFFWNSLPNSIGALTALETLDLSVYGQAAIPDNFTNLTNLTYLQLPRVHRPILSGTFSLPHITCLGLYSAAPLFTDLGVEIPLFTTLKFLTYTISSSDCDAKGLTKFTNLRKLILETDRSEKSNIAAVEIPVQLEILKINPIIQFQLLLNQKNIYSLKKLSLIGEKSVKALEMYQGQLGALFPHLTSLSLYDLNFNDNDDIFAFIKQFASSLKKLKIEIFPKLCNLSMLFQTISFLSQLDTLSWISTRRNKRFFPNDTVFTAMYISFHKPYIFSLQSTKSKDY